MADMGFLPQVKRLIDRMPTSRQTMLWSATLDGDVDQVVRAYQRSPRRHDLVADEDSLDVTHHFWRVDRETKAATAAGLLHHHRSGIVFVRTRHGADRVVRQLAAAGVETVAIHGQRSQAQRERSLSAFRAGTVRGLVATDVAARGIHVDDVGVIIHWDPVEHHKDYVHRSGRTGRAGASGTVISLVTDDVRSKTVALQRALDLPVGLDNPHPEGAAERVRPTSAPPAPASRPGSPGAGQPRLRQPGQQDRPARRPEAGPREPRRRQVRPTRTPEGGRPARPNRATRRAHLQPSSTDNRGASRGTRSR